MEIVDPRRRGIEEHSRFHDLVSAHHNNIVRRYKYYSYGILLVSASLLASIAIIFTSQWQVYISNSDQVFVFVLCGIPLLSFCLYLCDFLVLSSVFDSNERLYINEMPHKLLRCDMYASEKRYITNSQPNGFIPDQLFYNDEAQIVICDTKTRDKLKVYSSDVEQLSRYASELGPIEGRPICPTAYIRCVTPSTTRFLPVKLRF
ncbi:hypothetical protein [Halomonas sp. KO116]|uniref:hypothetical protein n=1 Tax=Halomonas sp. KO116 TaxID=1504981 RepID=UPI0004E3C2CF|nr:hypothetical protein [Halomonas sp. KO116]AJY53242.1 hypothetical protein KO116_P200135 [Halomonas sp. KO116]